VNVKVQLEHIYFVHEKGFFVFVFVYICLLFLLVKMLCMFV